MDDNRRKEFLSIPRQVELMKARGLLCPQDGSVESFLKRNSYYRISGYFRYFQNAPAHGDESFRAGTTWQDIHQIYAQDSKLRSLLTEALQQIEVTTRTAFAHCEADIHSPYEKYLREDAYTLPPSNRRIVPTNELIISELKRSKEPFIAKFESHGINDRRFNDVPVWAAVEVMSFGTLSKAIQYRNDHNQVYEAVCSMLGTKKPFLASQLHSFTFLRNRCAHYSRLWNSVVLKPPRIQPEAKRQARDLFGNYASNSVFAVIVAMNEFLTCADLRDGFLDQCSALIGESQMYTEGILTPRRS